MVSAESIRPKFEHVCMQVRRRFRLNVGELPNRTAPRHLEARLWRPGARLRAQCIPVKPMDNSSNGAVNDRHLVIKTMGKGLSACWAAVSIPPALVLRKTRHRSGAMDDSPRALKRKLKYPQSLLACEACRAKKVRCDMTERRTTCSGCERKGMTCKIVPGRRQHLVDRMLNRSDSKTPAVSQPLSPASHRSTSSEHSHSPATTSPWTFLLSGNDDSLPELPTRLKLIEAYEKWIHPLLPMVDLHKLVAEAHEPSLLLLSVMLAASSFVEVGAPARIRMRDHIQYLMDRTDSNRIDRLQSMILMTYVEPNPSGDQDWLSRACIQAEDLLRYAHSSQRHTNKMLEAVRSLLIRDVTLSLSRRSPCRVRIELPWDDLEIWRIDWFNSSGDGSSDVQQDNRTEAFGALLSLCSAVRSALDVYPDIPADPGTGLAQTLSIWAHLYMPVVKSCLVNGKDSEIIHWATVSGVWSLAAVTFFCCQRSSPLPTTGSDATQLVSMAIAVSTKINEQLYERNLVRLLPSTSISTLIPVTIAHLMNTTSEDNHTRRQSTQRYYMCWQVLRELRNKFAEAGAAMSTIDSLGQRIRRGMDTSHADRAQQVRERAGSMSASISSPESLDMGVYGSTSSPESLNEAITPTSGIDDEAWLTLLSEQPEDFFGDSTEVVVMPPSMKQESCSAQIEMIV